VSQQIYWLPCTRREHQRLPVYNAFVDASSLTQCCEKAVTSALAAEKAKTEARAAALEASKALESLRLGEEITDAEEQQNLVEQARIYVAKLEKELAIRLLDGQFERLKMLTSRLTVILAVNGACLAGLTAISKEELTNKVFDASRAGLWPNLACFGLLSLSAAVVIYANMGRGFQVTAIETKEHFEECKANAIESGKLSEYYCDRYFSKIQLKLYSSNRKMIERRYASLNCTTALTGLGIIFLMACFWFWLSNPPVLANK